MTIRDQMKFHELQAQWWMHSASNGHTRARKLFHGTSADPSAEFTDEEKVSDAMETAQRHINLFRELADKAAEVKP